MKKIIGLFVAMLACSAVQSENYSSVSYTKISVEGSAASIDLAGISGTYGTVLGDGMSAELRFGIGVDDYRLYDGYGDYIDTEADHYYGGYLKFSSTSGDILPYAILGITKFKTTTYDSYDDETYKESEDDFSYGLGLDFASGLNIEYMQYFDKNGIEINGLSFGSKF